MALSPHCISTEIMCDGQMPPDSIKGSSACLLIISVIKALLYLPETPERIAMAVDMAIVSIKLKHFAASTRNIPHFSLICKSGASWWHDAC